MLRDRGRAANPPRDTSDATAISAWAAGTTTATSRG